MLWSLFSVQRSRLRRRHLRRGAYLYVESIESEAEDSAGFSHGEKLYLRILVNDEEKDAVSSRFYPTE